MATTKTICFANNKGGSGKSTTCANVGTKEEVLAAIDEINADDAIHGCLMFRPLPKHLKNDQARGLARGPFPINWSLCPNCRPFVYGIFTDIFARNF